MDNIDTYYINLYKSKFRTSDDKKVEEDNATAFSEYCINHPTELKSLFDWYFNVYFEGLHENSTVKMFETDLEKAAREGQTKIILFDERRELVMLNDCTGMFGFMFNREYGLDKATKKTVYKIMERIKRSTEIFTFKMVDWDYFFSELWYDTVSNIYLRYISDHSLFVTCFIADLLRGKLNHYGIKLEYIQDDDTKLHRSGLGIDLGYLFETDETPYILSVDNLIP